MVCIIFSFNIGAWIASFHVPLLKDIPWFPDRYEVPAAKDITDQSQVKDGQESNSEIETTTFQKFTIDAVRYYADGIVGFTTGNQKFDFIHVRSLIDQQRIPLYDRLAQLRHLIVIEQTNKLAVDRVSQMTLDSRLKSKYEPQIANRKRILKDLSVNPETPFHGPLPTDSQCFYIPGSVLAMKDVQLVLVDEAGIDVAKISLEKFHR